MLRDCVLYKFTIDIDIDIDSAHSGNHRIAAAADGLLGVVSFRNAF